MEKLFFKFFLSKLSRTNLKFLETNIHNKSHFNNCEKNSFRTWESRNRIERERERERWGRLTPLKSGREDTLPLSPFSSLPLPPSLSLSIYLSSSLSLSLPLSPSLSLFYLSHSLSHTHMHRHKRTQTSGNEKKENNAWESVFMRVRKKKGKNDWLQELRKKWKKRRKKEDRKLKRRKRVIHC